MLSYPTFSWLWFHLFYLLAERKIASFLSAIGQKFLTMYRSFGTYIAFLTILLTIYLVTPNYVSFGYVFLLLVWITGRQLLQMSKRRLWFPLKVYAIVVLIFIYSLSAFPSLEMRLSTFIDLKFYLGYKSDASLLANIWESLAILIVMQLYSYERRQSMYNVSKVSSPMEPGVVGFVKRLLIWHSQKILFVAVFYASLSPISAFGFIYLLGLIICSNFPKASRLPSKLFLVYTGFLLTTEYLFQMWGRQAGMFPGQKHSDLSAFLGFSVYKPGFWGLESGLRGKVLVIAACTLQYNVFRWLETVPGTNLCKGKWEEPCPLFVSEDDALSDCSTSDGPSASPVSVSLPIRRGGTSKSWPSLQPESSKSMGSNTGGGGGSGSKKFSFGYIWGSTKESHKWNKKRITALRKERFEMQKTLLKIYLKFWMENMINLFGLEINMIALLLASFALLNAISILYIALIAACILLARRIICKLWPAFVFLSASILLLEYCATWKNAFWINHHGEDENSVHCHDCWRISTEYFSFCKNCWLGISPFPFYYFVCRLASLGYRTAVRCLNIQTDFL